MHRLTASIAVLAICIVICAGCNTGPRMAPVKGTVSHNGKPLANGTIRFESTGQRPATGKIVNGEIVEMTTFKTNDGVPVGAHKIAVWASEDAGSGTVGANPGEVKVGANYMSGKSLIHENYNNPDTSGLTAEIKSGDNVVEFKLVSNPTVEQK